MVATNLFNCGYSFADKRWISCKSVEEARCGSLQCAIERNSTDSIKSKLGNLFDLIKTGTIVSKTHECALLVIKQNQYQLDKEKQIPFYPQDGKICSTNDSINLKFCLNGACKSGSEFKELKTCLANAYCSSDQKCTYQNECRCDLNKSSEFNFTSSYYCPRQRLLNRRGNKKSFGALFENFNFYHLLIVPCFAAVLVLASFLRSYLRTGTYKIRDTSDDELSISFSGPRPAPVWQPKKQTK